MRKYTRLALVLVTCLSFILMFAYRQKYSKLTLIFEMMNAFQFQDSEGKCNERLFQFKNSLKTDFNVQEQIAGVPYWTEIFPGIYFYSSYWLSKMTRSFLLTKNISSRALEKIQCKLYYEGREHAGQPKTTMIVVEKNGSNNFIFLECVPIFDTQVPHSISFVHNNLTSLAFPVISHQSYNGHYTMCIQPLPQAFGDLYRLLEFIIYHSHIGVKHFVFYETGLSFKAKQLLMDIAIKDGIYILLLPWNLPSGSQLDFSRTEIHFLDCFHRVFARNQSDFILKLTLNDFIVPQENWGLTHLRKDFDFPLIKFHEKKFCSEYSNDVIAHNLNMPFLSLLKTKFSNENYPVLTAGYDVGKLKEVIVNSKEFHMWLNKKRVQKSNLVPRKSAVLHSYDNCGLKYEKQKEDFTEDKEMWKYKDTFFKSHLYILAKEANLINY